jgi:hypothetical protein
MHVAFNAPDQFRARPTLTAKAAVKVGTRRRAYRALTHSLEICRHFADNPVEGHPPFLSGISMRAVGGP